MTVFERFVPLPEKYAILDIKKHQLHIRVGNGEQNGD